MNRDKFNKVLERRIKLTKDVLGKKAVHYASPTDRFHNFKRAAGLLGNEPEQALLGMWVKHVVSITDMVQALPDRCAIQELWDEKIGDAINYLILLDGLIQERKEG